MLDAFLHEVTSTVVAAPADGEHKVGDSVRDRYVAERRLRYTPYYLRIADNGSTFVHGKIEIPATSVNQDGTLCGGLFGMYSYRGSIEQMIEEMRGCADIREFIKRPNFKVTAEDKVSIGDLLTGAKAPQDIERSGGAGPRAG